MKAGDEIIPVPWAYMPYGEIERRGLMSQLIEHVSKMDTQKADNYLQYLESLCEFPPEFRKEWKEMKKSVD